MVITSKNILLSRNTLWCLGEGLTMVCHVKVPDITLQTTGCYVRPLGSNEKRGLIKRWTPVSVIVLGLSGQVVLCECLGGVCRRNFENLTLCHRQRHIPLWRKSGRTSPGLWSVFIWSRNLFEFRLNLHLMRNLFAFDRFEYAVLWLEFMLISATFG